MVGTTAQRRYAQGDALVPQRTDAVDNLSPAWFTVALAALLERRDLSREQVRIVMQEMIAGRCGDAEAAALLIALRMKGETAIELAGAAAALREHMVRLDTGAAEVLDTCGTGGDGLGTFNISTATALVVAGAGVPVVKHGNRAVSGGSGSADVLAALGVALESDLAHVRRCLDEAGLAFCFAPHFHPALRHVGAVRRRLRVRTLFNCIGPLANPAGAAFQLLGVGKPEWLDPMAGALAELGIRRALLVCGRDGLDEVSLSAPTMVREVCERTITVHEWTPRDFGLEPCALADLRAEGAEASAAMVRSVLQGDEGAAGRVVLANAAAALRAAERVGTLPEGVALAREAIQSGRARRVLERLTVYPPRGA
jgi:anthranilate phosphoribosyltransferase